MSRKRKLAVPGERCRLCLARDACLSPLFVDWLQPKIDDLQRCSDVQIVNRPELPQSICYVCLYKLEMWSDFKQQFLETNKSLLSQVELQDHEKKAEETQIDGKRLKVDNPEAELEEISSSLTKPTAESLEVTETIQSPLSDGTSITQRSNRSKKIEREASTKRWMERKNALIAATGELLSESDSDNGIQLSPVQKARVRANTVQEEEKKRQKLQKALRQLETNLTPKYRVDQPNIVEERRTRSRRGNEEPQTDKSSFIEKIEDVPTIGTTNELELEKKNEQIEVQCEIKEVHSGIKEVQSETKVVEPEMKVVEPEMKVVQPEIKDVELPKISVVSLKTMVKSPEKLSEVKQLENISKENNDVDDLDVVNVDDEPITIDVPTVNLEKTENIPPKVLMSKVTLGDATYFVTTTLEMPNNRVVKSDISLNANGIDESCTDTGKTDVMNAVRLRKINNKIGASGKKNKKQGNKDEMTNCMNIDIEGMEPELLQKVQSEFNKFVDVEAQKLNEKPLECKIRDKSEVSKDSFESLSHQLKIVFEKVLRTNQKIKVIKCKKFSQEFLKAAEHSSVFQPEIRITRPQIGKLCKTYRINNLHILEELKRKKGLVGPLSRVLGKRKHKMPKKFEDYYSLTDSLEMEKLSKSVAKKNTVPITKPKETPSNISSTDKPPNVSTVTGLDDHEPLPDPQPATSALTESSTATTQIPPSAFMTTPPSDFLLSPKPTPLLDSKIAPTPMTTPNPVSFPAGSTAALVIRPDAPGITLTPTQVGDSIVIISSIKSGPSASTVTSTTTSAPLKSTTTSAPINIPVTTTKSKITMVKPMVSKTVAKEPTVITKKPVTITKIFSKGSTKNVKVEPNKSVTITDSNQDEPLIIKVLQKEKPANAKAAQVPQLTKVKTAPVESPVTIKTERKEPPAKTKGQSKESPVIMKVAPKVIAASSQKATSKVLQNTSVPTIEIDDSDAMVPNTPTASPVKTNSTLNNIKKEVSKAPNTTPSAPMKKVVSNFLPSLQTLSSLPNRPVTNVTNANTNHTSPNKQIGTTNSVSTVNSSKAQSNNIPKVTKRQRHICGICGKELFSKEEAEIHVKNHKLETKSSKAPPKAVAKSTPTPTSANEPKPKPKLMRCKRCQAIVEARHVKTHACNSIKFNCTMCECSFGVEHLLIAHLETHTKSKLPSTKAKERKSTMLHDDRNSKVSEAEQDDMEEMLADKEPQGYSCFVCDKVFVDEDQMKDHLQMHCEEVSEEISEKCSFQCAFCGEKFQTEESLETHVGNHLMEDGDEKIKMMINLETNPNRKRRIVYKCDQCSETFASSMLLNMHLPLHEEEAVVLTEYERSQDEDTIQEIVEEDADQHYVCTICDEIFDTSEELSEHLDVHNGNAHVCILCEKPFSSIKDLQDHVSTHL